MYPLLIASEMTKPDPLFILAGSSFTEALSVFADGDASTLPVVDNSQDRKLIGVITHQDVMMHYHHSINQEKEQ